MWYRIKFLIHTWGCSYKLMYFTHSIWHGPLSFTSVLSSFERPWCKGYWFPLLLSNSHLLFFTFIGRTFHGWVWSTQWWGRNPTHDSYLGPAEYSFGWMVDPVGQPGHLVRWTCDLHGLYKCFLFTFWTDIVGPDSTDFDLVFLCGPFAWVTSLNNSCGL